MGQNKKPNLNNQDDFNGGELKISLKQAAVAPPANDAGNSPMLGGINTGKSAPDKSSAKAAPAKAPSGSPDKQKQRKKATLNPEVSRVKGLSSATNLTKGATELGPAMISPSSGFGRYIKWIFILALVGGIGYCAYDEAIRTTIIKTVVDTKKKAIALVRYQPKKRNKNTQKILYDQVEKQKKVTVAVSEPVKRSGPRNCQTLISESIGANIGVQEHVFLAECYLMIDDFVAAEQNLSRIRQRLQSTPEKKLNAGSSSKYLADAYLTLTTVYAMQGKFREAIGLTSGKCQRWAITNTCVARAIIAAMRTGKGNVDKGVGAMFQTNGGLDRKVQARLWWAGGLLADKDNNRSVIDQRFKLAMKTVPNDAIALKKTIYESYAVNLYNRFELIKLNAVVARALGELGRIDRKAKVKLQTLQSLATSRNKGATVRTLLASEPVAYRARNDFELLEILGSAAIASQQNDGYLRLAKKSREFFIQKKYETHPYERNLSQWEIRMQIGKSEYETALTYLGNYERRVGRDLFFYHLRGVVYHMMSPDPRFQIQAATEFQSALRTRKNWESLYALGLTLLRGNKQDETATVLKDLERMIKTKGQKYWLEMLKAEWYVAKKKYLNAEKILLDWSKMETEFFTPRRLLVELYRTQKRSADALRIETELVEISRTKLYETSFEGLTSPLGLMAVGERPLE